MMAMASRCFHDVTVGFPSGAPADHSKLNDWRSLNWVVWSTGELRVDSSTFALVFLPGGPLRGNLSAKPLGCLLSAAPTLAESGLRTFMAKTNDPVHGMMCLSFRSTADEEAFVNLARSAEVSPACCGYAPSTRSSSMSAVEVLQDDAATQKLVAAIRSEHPARCPAVYPGAEIYGPDPFGEQGSEVLLGRGAMVLLDPVDDGRVGAYELLFYEEGDGRAILKVPISARTSVTPQPQEAFSRLSVSRRLSCRPCMGASFDFSVHGERGWAVAFDTEEDGEAFARDLKVRNRVLALSGRTSHSQRLLSGLQDDLFKLQQFGLVATLRGWLVHVLLCAVLVLAGYTAILYNESPQRSLADIAQDAFSDAAMAAVGIGGLALDAGAGICQLFVRTPPAHSLEHCLSLPDTTGELRSCVAVLLGS